jgi:hypothetical protein
MHNKWTLFLTDNKKVAHFEILVLLLIKKEHAKESGFFSWLSKAKEGDLMSLSQQAYCKADHLQSTNIHPDYLALQITVKMQIHRNWAGFQFVQQV